MGRPIEGAIKAYSIVEMNAVMRKERGSSSCAIEIERCASARPPRPWRALM